MTNKCFRPVSVLTLTLAAVGLILTSWPTVGQCQRSRQQSSMRAEAADPNAPAAPNSWDSFEIILDRNIFSRTRRPAVRFAPRDEQPVAPAPNPESYFVLRGVVQENDDFVAFIEDTRTGMVQKLRRGDPVSRGSIKTLTLDGLEYQMEDKTVVVRMGLDLEGRAGGMTTRQMLDLAATTPAPSTTEAAPSAPSASPPSGDEADILKRLMEQRKQQLGQ